MESSLRQRASALTRIEMVMLLQSVGLFKFCSAVEIVRIAGIAQLREFGAREIIYRSNDVAESLYCVVDGRVSLETPGTEPEVVGPRQAFGVLEILSGRLRHHDAQALEPTATLAIAADDFFDLLSNNVEIVRALFREVLHDRGDRSRTLR